MRPSGKHLYKRICPSVRPSVRPSVCPLRFLKNRSFRLFSATAMSRIKLSTIWDASRPFYLSVRPSICHSIYLTCLAPKSIHAETQSGRIVARSGLFSFYSLVPATDQEDNKHSSALLGLSGTKTKRPASSRLPKKN